jgi:hypothetical protein
MNKADSELLIEAIAEIELWMQVEHENVAKYSKEKAWNCCAISQGRETGLYRAADILRAKLSGKPSLGPQKMPASLGRVIAQSKQAAGELSERVSCERHGF